MTTEHYQLKKARADNHKAILHLLEQCRLPHDDISAGDLKHYFIIEHEHEVIGTIGLEAFEGYGLLRSLALREEFRNMGFGKKLVSKLEDRASELNIKELYLLTTTADSYFSKLGYQKTSRDQAPESIKASEEFSNLCPSTAVFMKKTLTQP